MDDRFYSSELMITDLLDVWEHSTDHWERKCFAQRHMDGLIYMITGTIDYTFSDRTERCAPGEVLLLRASDVYSGKKVGNSDNSFIVIDFNSDTEKSFAAYPLPTVFKPQDPTGTERKFREILSFYQSGKPGKNLECLSRIYALTADLLREAAENQVLTEEESRALKFRRYADTRFSDPTVNVESMASAFSLSTVHFRRLFSEAFGISPHDYLFSLRMKKAEDILLHRPEVTVGETAAACGFTGTYYFSNAFKKVHGCSPKAYREAHKSKI